MSKRGGQRGLFDPSKMKAAEMKDSGTAISAVTVSQLNGMIRGAMQSAFPESLDVVGELSNISRPAAGHIYFTLKDATSEVRCVMWRSDAARLKFNINDGLEVVVSGKVDVYEPRGQLQLYVRTITPRGIGALELAFQQLKEKLSAEGLFDAGRKRKLPRFPKTIAVITSGTGAAIRDILDTLQRRYPVARVVTVGVRVQGDGAANEIADAIRLVNDTAARFDGIDVMIVGRGGGSIEDLWAFNEEVVARAIYKSKIPVISAVGHEVDFTIADFVADVRAATPTAAAELAVPVREEIVAYLAETRRRLSRDMRELISDHRRRIDSVSRTRWFRDPIGEIRLRHQRLDELGGRLRFLVHRTINDRRKRIGAAESRLVRGRPSVQLAKRRTRTAAAMLRLLMAMNRRIGRQRIRLDDASLALSRYSPKHDIRRCRAEIATVDRRMRYAIAMRLRSEQKRLESLGDRIVASSPQSVLKRGYTITRKWRGNEVIRSIKQLTDGDRVVTATADGEFESRVVELHQRELFE